MAYVKTTWTSTTIVDTTKMNNLETQYDEAYAAAVAHNHDTRYYTKAECDGWFWNTSNDGTGSGCDADLLYYAGGNKHYADFTAGGVQQYTIILWEGVSPPSGWVECDGTGGTPDLRDRFVLGAGGSYSVGASGGYNQWTQNYNITVTSHTLTTAELPVHSHIWEDNYCVANTGRGGGDAPSSGVNKTGASGTTNATGSGGSHGHTSSYATINWTENKPPCVALRYIMKS
jgi:microcystin-dependent protein